MYDMNDAGPQRDNDPMPDGTHVKAVMVIRPGMCTPPDCDAMDQGLFRASNSSDATMLDCEFTVVEGPHKGRKWWQMFTVAGGKTDEKGQSKGWLISKATIRAIIESATGLDPDDMSDRAKAMRMFGGFKQLDGIEFFARVGVEAGGDNPETGKPYPDKNKIDRVLTVKDAEYAALKAGQDVPPHQRGVRAGSVAGTIGGAGQPAWALNGAGTSAAKPAATSTAAAPSTPAWAKPAGASGAVAGNAPAATAAKTGPAWLNQ